MEAYLAPVVAAAAALLAGSLAGPVVLPALAASVPSAGPVTWGTPTATSVFGIGITFQQPVAADRSEEHTSELQSP